MADTQIRYIEKQLEELLKDKASVSARAWDIAMKAAVPLVLAACGTLITHEVRLSSVESRTVSIPPEWFKDMVNEMRQDQMKTRDELREMISRIAIIESKVDRLVKK